jgi:hypothetical protein
MCEGVSSLAVQWAYWDGRAVSWFPSEDPDGDGLNDDSHFDELGADVFGVYFNVPGSADIPSWRPIGSDELKYKRVDEDGAKPFDGGFRPKALKFTFTLRDSKGLIKGGREFTHIVYLE